MTATRIITNKNVAWRIGSSTAIADPTKPLLSEITAMLDMSEAVKTDGTTFNTDVSDTADDRSYADNAGAKTRTYPKFGGPIAFFEPRPTDTTSTARQVRTLVKTPWTVLWIAVRLGAPASTAPAAGDIWNVYRVVVDANKYGRNPASYFYTVNMVPNDLVGINRILPAASATAVTMTPTPTAAASVGSVGFLTATYQGRNITVGATYTVSDPTKLEVNAHGVYRALAAGTVTVTPTFPGSAAGTATTFTIT